MSNINLLTDPFFPVVTQGGHPLWVDFSSLMQDSGDYPVAFNWPRADLNIASAELCIGLLSLIYQPHDHEDWTGIWRGTIDVDVPARMSALAPHFNLLGDENGHGPRFMQDFASLDGETSHIEALFIDTPGINGQNKNADLLTHRDRFPALGLKAAAITLYAKQQYASGDGPGFRTSIRGGGPMTTLYMPSMTNRGETPLCRMLLANLPIVSGGWLDDVDLARALPWLKPTITSVPQKSSGIGTIEEQVHQTDQRVHPIHAYFGMPRRIRFCEPSTGRCALTDDLGPVIRGFVQKRHGYNYGDWQHPLTPYRQLKEIKLYSVKPQSARFGYRDWVGVVIGKSDLAAKAIPSPSIKALTERYNLLLTSGYNQFRLLAAGWAMETATAGTFLQSVQPLYQAASLQAANRIATTARKNAEAADRAAVLLRGAINEALFGGQAKSTDAGVFEEANDSFFSATENRFHALLAALLREPEIPIAGEGPAPDVEFDDSAARSWLAELGKTALTIFDRYCSSQLTDRMDIKLAERVTSAYAKLNGGLGNNSKLAKELGILSSTGDAKPARKSTTKTQKLSSAQPA